MINNRKEAIIFDFDGVIANSEPFNTFACLEAGKMCGINIERQVYMSYAPPGRSLKEIAEGLMSHYDRSELVDQFIQCKKSFDPEYMTKVEIYQNVKKAIAYLSNYYVLAICSGARRNLIDGFLSTHRLSQYFDKSNIITSEDVTRGKPDPEGYNLIIKKLNEDSKKVIVVEDGESGVKAGKAAGAYVIGITNTTTSLTLVSAGADKIISDLSELMAPTSV